MKIRADISLGPPKAGKDKKNVLWEATLDQGNNRFLFREVDDFLIAGKTAVELAESSPAVQMIGARVNKVERIARLWN